MYTWPSTHLQTYRASWPPINQWEDTKRLRAESANSCHISPYDRALLCIGLSMLFFSLFPLSEGESEARSSKGTFMGTKFKRRQFIIEILSDRKLKPLGLGGVAMGTRGQAWRWDVSITHWLILHYLKSALLTGVNYCGRQVRVSKHRPSVSLTRVICFSVIQLYGDRLNALSFYYDAQKRALHVFL